MANFKNIPLSQYRLFLLGIGLKQQRKNGGHEIWAGKGYARPIVIQTHIDPVPKHIIAANNRTLGLTNQQFMLKFEEILGGGKK